MMSDQPRHKHQHRVLPPGPPNRIIRTPYPFSEHPTGWERVAMILTYGLLFGFMAVSLVYVLWLIVAETV